MYEYTMCLMMKTHYSEYYYNYSRHLHPTCEGIPSRDRRQPNILWLGVLPTALPLVVHSAATADRRLLLQRPWAQSACAVFARVFVSPSLAPPLLPGDGTCFFSGDSGGASGGSGGGMTRRMRLIIQVGEHLKQGKKLFSSTTRHIQYILQYTLVHTYIHYTVYTIQYIYTRTYCSTVHA